MKDNTTFADYCINRCHFRKTKLDEINVRINWTPVQEFLDKEIGKKVFQWRNPVCSPMVLFKCLILQRLNNLNDHSMAELLADSFSALRFCNLSLTDRIPEYRTIRRFRKFFFRNNNAYEFFEKFFEQVLEIKNSLSKELPKRVQASLLFVPDKTTRNDKPFKKKKRKTLFEVFHDDLVSDNVNILDMPSDQVNKFLLLLRMLPDSDEKENEES